MLLRPIRARGRRGRRRSRARPGGELGWGLWVNGRVSGGGRGGASRMNETNVPRARRRACPGERANGNAGRARDPALRQRPRAGSKTSVAGRERAEQGGRRACGGRALPLRGRTALPGGGGDNDGGGDGSRAGGEYRGHWPLRNRKCRASEVGGESDL